MFVNLENNRMFAVRYIVMSGFTASNDSGFFISDCEHTGYNTPVYHCNGDTAHHECNATGKVIAFFYFQIFKHFYSVMRYTENNVLAMNNSNCKDTPCGAKTASTLTFSEILSELEERFVVEKNSKNEAYSFILQMGLLDEFRKFKQATQGQNHFSNCLTSLTQKQSN